MPQYRTIPLIWIDPEAMGIIRKSKSSLKLRELKNIYYSLCEMKYYQLSLFSNPEKLYSKLASCSGEIIPTSELCCKELEYLKLIKFEISPNQFKFTLLEIPKINKSVNINSVVPIPVKEKLAQPTKTSPSKGTVTNMPISVSSRASTLNLVPLKKDPRIKESIDYFFQRCYEIKGFKPEISGASEGRMIKEKLKRYSVEEMKEAFDWFLESEESENLGCTIKLCLSNYIFNKWLAQRVY